MTKNTLVVFLIALFALTGCKSEAEKIADQNAIIENTINSFQKKLLKNQIDSVFQKYQFNGIVSVKQGDSVLYQRAQGYENFKTGKKISPESVFAIASISKQFTAVLLLQLLEEQKIRLDDKVGDYLPDFDQHPMSTITIRQLLDHTSGISDFGQGLLSAPGKEFHYSNKGFRMLGEIIEKVSGVSYGENVRNLFTKVGMTHSGTALEHQNQNLADAYLGTVANANLVENMPARLAEPAISIPAGGILSTSEDLHLWNKTLYGGKLLAPETLALFTTKSSERNHQILGKINYGLGIMSNIGMPNSYFHTGYVKGAPSLMIYYPDTQTSVVILSNIANEATGKNSIFTPHKMIKQSTDMLQNTVTELRKELLTAAVED